MFSFFSITAGSDSYLYLFLSRLNFLSINRFERKKNIDLAISAFAMLHTLEGVVFQNHNLDDAFLTIAGNFQTILSFLYP